jgi:hypothetical protein
MMSRLFNRAITCICMPTYGLPFDLVMMALQRCLPMALPTRASRTLYLQTRSALLDDATRRCVILCHAQSALMVSACLSQLCADLPADNLRKLEIYTFGCAASEFLLPLGDAALDMSSSSDQTSTHPADSMLTSPHATKTSPTQIHIEHFALSSDPLAQLGVLRSVRHDMTSRLCGGVFVLNTPKAMATSCAMEDYLAMLFPQGFSSPTSPPTRSILDAKMHIDRDCAEKREITAMSAYYRCKDSYSGAKGKNGSKRLSWTGLAAASGGMNGGAGVKNGVSAGMAGLEMARRGCKDCAGNRGREVTRLVRYVNMKGLGMGIGGGMEKGAP